MEIFRRANELLKKRMNVVFAIVIIVGLILRFCAMRSAPYFIDLYADAYESRVVLDEPVDMYMKELEMSERERTCDGSFSEEWTKEQCSPYPPIAILLDSVLYQAGGATLEGFYLVQVIFELGISAIVCIYCYRGKEPLMFILFFLNPFEISEFWHESHASFLWMHLFSVVAYIAYDYGYKKESALFLGLAIATKLYPASVMLFPRKWGKAYFLLVAIVGLGLLLPFLIPGYSYIWQRKNYHFLLSVLFAIISGIMLTLLSREKWVTDLDLIGFSSIPVALYVTLGKYMIFPNYAMMALMLPDKRYFRPLFCMLIWVVMFFEHEITPIVVSLLIMPIFYLVFRKNN
ncbi:MAG: hypothetical protein QXT63_06000 [Thermoplasmata archaeon]